MTAFESEDNLFGKCKALARENKSFASKQVSQGNANI